MGWIEYRKQSHPSWQAHSLGATILIETHKNALMLISLKYGEKINSNE
jgi:hypothetical protein